MTIPINTPRGGSPCEIRFGDTIEITEADGTTTAWEVQGPSAPTLKPTSALPTDPGIYAIRGHSGPLTDRRRLLLSTDGVWNWLDFTRGGSLEPAEIDQVEAYAEDLYRAGAV